MVFFGKAKVSTGIPGARIYQVSGSCREAHSNPGPPSHLNGPTEIERTLPAASVPMNGARAPKRTRKTDLLERDPFQGPSSTQTVTVNFYRIFGERRSGTAHRTGGTELHISVRQIFHSPRSSLTKIGLSTGPRTTPRLNFRSRSFEPKTCREPVESATSG